MIIDFSKTCNTYDKNSYTKKSFANTSCPKCPAIGKFNLHGSYQRYILYFDEKHLVYDLIDIKRVRCRSCKSTHAVMPGDLIPYKLLSLFVVIYILYSCLVEKVPVLKVAEQNGFSFQFIYSCLIAFSLYKNRIHLYFMETSPADTPHEKSYEKVVSLIKKPYLKFQSGFTKHNHRPCFMCKFFNSTDGPPIGIHALWQAAT